MKLLMHTQDVAIPAGAVALPGTLHMPESAAGVVVFAHGSGSGRFSPRNRFVASALNDAGLGTLLFDLLTADESAVDEHTATLRFDIRLLADRLTGAIDWLVRQPGLARMKLGLFGASTGAAGALVAAAERPSLVGAVVSRGGRPDLAGDVLPRVEAPTLLIVGGEDTAVIELNRLAAAQLRVDHRLQIIPGASHLFPEPGALEQVADLARTWFNSYFRP